MKYKHLFGPVPSRRLGISLGVDLVPHKTCSLNCIYCECAETTNLTIERKEYIPTKEILKELSGYLADNPKLDYITFSGAGEPTLHSGIGEITNFIKNNYPDYKIALLTNATLFDQPGLIEEIKNVDLLIPSLDVVSEIAFQELNRPHSQLRISNIIDSLIRLKKVFKGQFWLEIFIVPGLNDNDQEIKKLAITTNQINPDRIQLNTLDRPGAENWVQQISEDKLNKIAAQFGPNAEIIAKFKQRKKVYNYNPDVENSIIQLIKRRPCTKEDLTATLGLHINEVNKYLKILIYNKKVLQEVLERGIFYRVID